MVRPDYSAIDHLQAGFAAATVVEGFEQQLPKTRQRPAPELAINRRPFAKMFMQIAPGNTCPCDPENSIQNKAMISRTPPASRTALDHERLKTSPFIVAHQTSDQSSLPKDTLNQILRDLGIPFVNTS